MTGALSDIAGKLEPIRPYIHSCMDSEKRNKIFCLVEGEFDKRIYEQRLNSEDIEVKIAVSDELWHNRSTVETYVVDFRSECQDIRVFGIRDKDYSGFLGSVIPDGVFVTDERDLEMMILYSPSFIDYETSMDHPLKDAIIQGDAYCRMLAYIRIYHESTRLPLHMSDKVNIARVYDFGTKTFYADAENRLRQRYYTNVNPAATDQEINELIVKFSLTSCNSRDICRGHDVLGLVGVMLGNQYHEKQTHEKMEQHYSAGDFYTTSLFDHIQNYCQYYGVDARVQ